jgi:hypothetical protein
MMLMRKQHIVATVAALVIGLSAAEGWRTARADGSSVSFAAICAQKEVQAITLIEDHAAADDLAPDTLSETGATMLRARLACYDGHVSEAVALYEQILSLGPVKLAGGQ